MSNGFYIENGANQNLFSSFSNPSPALGSEFTSNNLFIDSPTVTPSNGGSPAKIYAPPSYSGGSSISHWDETTFQAGNPNALMTPFLSSGEAAHNPGPLTLGLFRDLGWTVRPAVNIRLSTATGLEVTQTPITVTVTTDQPVVGNQTVALTLSGLGVTASDFTGTIPSTVTIPNGQTQASFTINVNDDILVEGSENAIFTLSAPSVGMALGSTASTSLVITDNDNFGTGGIQNGDAAGNTITGTANNDRLNGGAGDDTITGLGGRDLIFGGTGADVFQYNLTDSLVNAPDRLATFSQSEGDRFRLLSGNPTGLFHAGTVTAAILSEAVVRAYGDADRATAGAQPLGSNQAVLFGFDGRTFLSINDGTAGFGATGDLVVEVVTFAFKSGDVSLGTLIAGDYFA